MHPLQVTQVSKFVKLWLVVCLSFVLIMVCLGGYTRLSGSGLSVTEWKPITGTIPPLNNQQWEMEFAKYKNSPEFKKINFHFSLDEFKKIYLVEYLHRLLGRIIGLIFLIPFIYFIWHKKLQPKQIQLLSTAFALGALQGFCGWYMVRSGLIDNPQVSHYRLALHLGLALLIFTIFFWSLLSLSNRPKLIKVPSVITFHTVILIVLLVAQIIFGAFVAGLKGGYIYNTFPLMNGNLIPDELYFHGLDLSNPAIVQFLHRLLALIILILASRITYLLITRKIDQLLVARSLLLTLSCSIQILLGIFTLVKIVPLEAALLHQIFAFVVFAFALYFSHPLTLSLIGSRSPYESKPPISI